MQTNNSFEKIYKSSIIRKVQNDPAKQKDKANKPKRDNSKREWK